MGMNPHAAALKSRIGGFRSMSDAAYNDAIRYAIKAGEVDAGAWREALKLKRGNLAMAFEEVLSGLDEDTAAKIQQDYDDALSAKQMEAEGMPEKHSAFSHIPGEEYESPEGENEPSEAMEYDPEDPYGGLPKGSRIPGRGSVHTAGFKPGEKKRLFGID